MSGDSYRGSMRVSVLIATYGERHWIDMAKTRALPSVWGAHEVLMGHHEGPIAAARNDLAASADGDWLLFLDADDEIAPGYLDAMERALEQVGGRPHTARKDGTYLLTPAVQQIRKGGVLRGKPVFYDRGIPLTDDNWLVVGTLIQRDLFMQVGGFSDYPHGFEDWSLWAKAWKAGAEIVKVPDAVYRYWINPRSKHKQGWRDRKWQVETHNKIRAELFPELV